MVHYDDIVDETGSKVTYLQTHEVDVFVEVLSVSLHTQFTQLQLLLLALEAGRDQSMDAEDLTLLQGEGHALQKNIDLQFNSHY